MAVAATLAALVTAHVSAGALPGLRAAEVAVFFYPWYGTPALDGAWEHWGQYDHAPPLDLATAFYPTHGPYSSTDAGVLRRQMSEIAQAGIDTVIVSWWGPDSVEAARLPQVSAAARVAGLRVALHVEPWLGRTPAAVAEAVRSLSARGIHDFYVYDSSLDDDADWASALAPLDDVRLFANTGFPGKALRGGFDGLYTYDVLVYDGSSFPRMCRSARKRGLVCAPSVGPGFDGRRASGIDEVRDRAHGAWYDRLWRAAIRSHVDVVTITSFNEWHEGTQIEPARAAGPAYGSYDGAYGATGPPARRAYLERTAYWVRRLR